MKDTVVSVVISTIISFILIAVCSFQYVFSHFIGVPGASAWLFWQTVEVDNAGSFRVPKEWVVEQLDNTIYITDKPLSEVGHKFYIVGVVNTYDTESQYTQPHELLEGVVKRGVQRGIVYSNSAHVDVCEYDIGGITQELFLVHFRCSSTISIDLLVWDKEVVNEKTASEIAKTFVSLHPNANSAIENSTERQLLEACRVTYCYETPVRELAVNMKNINTNTKRLSDAS
ncbi:MAG: hypothetical protein LBG68_03920 [Coriobacteriales bacterium]|jgi:hypothetical protein|nr:hypothetical protein [Coriobacteriales bacterium]